MKLNFSSNDKNLKINKSVKLNAVLNAIRSGLKVIFPLITFPYVARIFGTSLLGKVNYSQSIISYVTMFADLGINTYAVREGSKIRDNNDELKKFTNQIFSIGIINTILSLLIFWTLDYFIPSLHSYNKIMLILSLSVVFNNLGVDWINSVFEDYAYVTLRSIIIQVLNLLLLFIFVHSQKDVYIYAFLISLNTILMSIFNIIYCKKYVKLKFVTNTNLTTHIRPMLVFFANTLAVTLYCDSDTIMIGTMVGDYFTGLYALSVKVYTVIKNLGAAVILVTIPRLTNYYTKGELTEWQILLNKVFGSFIIVLLPATIGLIALAKPIILLLGGSEYIDSILTLRILSLALFFALFSGIITNCINITTGYEKNNLISTIIAAMTNIILNFFVIPVYYQNGAAFTTLIAEFLVIITSIIQRPKILKIIKSNTKIGMYFAESIVGAILAFAICKSSLIIFDSSILQCLFGFIISGGLYFLFLLIVKNEFAIMLLYKFKNMFNKKPC